MQKKKNVLLEFTQEKDPAIAFITSSTVTKPPSNPEIFSGFVICLNIPVYILNLIADVNVFFFS